MTSHSQQTCLLQQLGALRLAPASTWTSLVRTTTSKHWNPKFKKLRKQKFLKFPLPDFNEDTNALPPEKVRQKMKERGVLPPRPWMERPFYISATGGTFEAYIPPEGDGKASLASATRAKQTVELLEKKSKSMMAVRKIKSFEEDFDSKEFAQKAQMIYIKAHNALATGDKYALRESVTEKAYPEFRYNSFNKTIHWRFLDSLEPPRVVHARCTDVISKDNIFGQVSSFVALVILIKLITLVTQLCSRYQHQFIPDFNLRPKEISVYTNIHPVIPQQEQRALQSSSSGWI